MSKSTKKLKNPVRHLLKRMVDNFFDVCGDSDSFKNKLTNFLIRQSKFRKNISAELRKKIKNYNKDYK